MNNKLKFALTDTIAATPINLTLNFVFLTFAFKLEMTALEAAPFMTAGFFMTAIIRKYFIYSYMDKKNA